MKQIIPALIGFVQLWATSAGSEPVDLELVLGVDTSRSMEFEELKLQREGYAQALEHPAIIAGLESGGLGRIAITYFDWGGPGRYDIILPWTILESPSDAFRAADILRNEPVKNLSGTGISAAIDHAVSLIENNALTGTRRVIDISGDGPNNVGGAVTEARDRAASLGIEINGLPIMMFEPRGLYNIEDLDFYYEDCVITGPGAFVIPVHDKERLATSILQKLILEIAGQWPQPQPRLHKAVATDCLIGEKLRRHRNRAWEDDP
jgi:hypothetical protein